MKKLTYITAFLFLLILLLGSCSNDISNSSNLPDSDVLIQTQAEVSDLIQESGFSNLKYEKANWIKIHENYKSTIETNISHSQLFAYKQNLINYQIQNTSITENVNTSNIEIIKDYLKELEFFRPAYPKTNYIALKAALPYLDNVEIDRLARLSYKKGIDEKQKKKEKLFEMKNSELDPMISELYENGFKENYQVFLPKLKELFISNK